MLPGIFVLLVVIDSPMLFHVILSHSSADIYFDFCEDNLQIFHQQLQKMISAAGLLVTLLVVNSNVAVTSHTVSCE